MGMLDQIRQATGGNSNYRWPSQDIRPGAVVSDWVRVNNYYRWQNIYYGRFKTAFPREPAFYNMAADVGSAANLAARCVDALHSAIWKEAPHVETDVQPLSLFVEELLENTRNSHAIEDSVRDTILFGDGVLKVEIVDSKIRVRSIHPSLYFPNLVQPNIQEPLEHNIIWLEGGDNNQLYRRERYWFNEDTRSWWLTVTRFNIDSGAESDPMSTQDLLILHSPIVHTYSNRLSGLFWGKSPMMDAEQSISEYAATMRKIAEITTLASTEALLAAPHNAFDENGQLKWDTLHPYMVEDTDIGTFDKNKFGWLNPPGGELIEPSLSVLEKIEQDVLHSFGLATILWGDTGNLRDAGAPAIERVNLNLFYTIKRYQSQYELFLNDLFDVAREMALAHLGANQLPDRHVDMKFKWADFVPQSELEQAQALQAKMPLGLSKQQALRELGYQQPEAIVSEANSEAAGATILPHSPYDPANVDAELERSTENLFEN